MQFSSYFFFICNKNFTCKKIIYQIAHFTRQFCPQLSNFLHWTQCRSIEVLTKYTFALEIFRNFAYHHLITRLLQQRFVAGFEQSTWNKMRLLRQSNCNREILFRYYFTRDRADSLMALVMRCNFRIVVIAV